MSDQFKILNYFEWKALLEEVESQSAQQKAALTKFSNTLTTNAITQSNFASSINSSYDVEGILDFVIDLVSSVLDTIPGLGQGISFGIDMLHTLSYAIRAYLYEDENAKIKNGVMFGASLGTAFIPVGGNVANILARVGIDNSLKLAPSAIVKLTSKKWFDTSLKRWAMTTKWKFNFLFVLVRYLGDSAISTIADMHKSIKQIFDKVIPKLKQWVSDSIIGWFVHELISAIKHVYYLFSDFNSQVQSISKLIKEMG
jgi:hypothetical protein